MAEPHRTLSERAQPLLEEAAVRSRVSARTRAERVRNAARAILQATLAAVPAAGHRSETVSTFADSGAYDGVRSA